MMRYPWRSTMYDIMNTWQGVGARAPWFGDAGRGGRLVPAAALQAATPHRRGSMPAAQGAGVALLPSTHGTQHAVRGARHHHHHHKGCPPVHGAPC